MTSSLAWFLLQHKTSPSFGLHAVLNGWPQQVGLISGEGRYLRLYSASQWVGPLSKWFTTKFFFKVWRHGPSSIVCVSCQLEPFQASHWNPIRVKYESAKKACDEWSPFVGMWECLACSQQYCTKPSSGTQHARTWDSFHLWSIRKIKQNPACSYSCDL